MSDLSTLAEISIKNIGVIEDATLELDKGFTVLTGETGAGKTMVLTALALVLGGKADSSLLRQGKDRLAASATFRISDSMSKVVAEHGDIVEEGALILTRTLNSDGRSRAAAGGVSVPASLLSSLAEELIEIHGQAASASVTKASKQREILDRFGGAGIAQALSAYSVEFDQYHELKRKLSSLQKNSTESEREIRSLRAFADAFGKVKPKLGEFEALTQEISRLSSVETLRVAVSESAGLLDDEEIGAIRQLAQVKRSLDSILALDSSIVETSTLISEAFYLLTDASQTFHRYLEDLGIDPARLDAALSRRAEISALLKSYEIEDDPEEQILALTKKFELVEDAIADLDGGEERLNELQNEIDGRFLVLVERAETLSTLRKESAEKLAKEVTNEIKSLSMPHTKFICEVMSPDYGGEVAQAALTSTGADEIAMLLQGHVDAPKVPLSKGASGGEMSRVMLALEVVVASTRPVGTYIFDEVDAGVGGKAAVEVGRRLHELSKHAQVIVVTHLPQVAAWADSHFVVKKSTDGTVSQSDVHRVESEARVEEIARMLAGHEDSKSAREHATELLNMKSGIL